MRRMYAASFSEPSSPKTLRTVPKFTSQKIVTSPSSRSTGRRASITRVPPKLSGGHAHHARRLMDVLLQTAIQHMLQHAGISVVVLGRDDHDAIGALHLRGKALGL